MDRREVLRLLATGTALQLAPHRLAALWREARILLDAQTAPRTLNAHQDMTVKTMAELILPRTDTPGATDVGVAGFIDLLLTEWCDNAERSSFLSGIADVDARAEKLFGRKFIDCSPEQQAEILIVLGQTMERDRSPFRDRYFTESVPDQAFYSTLRRWALTAYYTSEAGATDELHFQMIPDKHEGCGAAQSEEEAPKAR